MGGGARCFTRCIYQCLLSTFGADGVGSRFFRGGLCISVTVKTVVSSFAWGPGVVLFFCFPVVGGVLVLVGFPVVVVFLFP